jgi:transporter family-2 protein
MPTYAITMLAAGIGIPVLAAMNAALGRHLGAPMLAGAILLAVGFLTALVVALITGPGAIVKLASAPRHLLLAGILVAFYVFFNWCFYHFFFEINVKKHVSQTTPLPALQ